MSERIKLFLGGHVNCTNAQNLNCLSIAKHIDKNRFVVKTMTVYSGDLETLELDSVSYINLSWPYKITKYWAYLRGLLWCDIAYLPKGEIVGFNRLILKIFKKKSLSTVEGILDDILLKTDAERKRAIDSYRGFTRLYSITRFMKDYNYRAHKIKDEEKILYLGTESTEFLTRINIDVLQNVILIGNDLLRKGIFDFFEIAKLFPALKFHIAGSGNGKIDVDGEILKRELKNVVYHGIVTKENLIKLLGVMDLQILPSRSEGFPKVILETASAGIPSIVYPDYGAEEWLAHKVNGFIVRDVQEATSIIKELIISPEKLKLVSKNAVELGNSFDWALRIEDWEDEIFGIFSNGSQ
jgi:glycosyltransferase involved in cell wall biosynthesis